MFKMKYLIFKMMISVMICGVMMVSCGGGSSSQSTPKTEQEVSSSSGNDYKSLAQQGVELLLEGMQMSGADAARREAFQNKSDALAQKVNQLSKEDKALYDAEFARLAKEARDNN